MLRQARRAAGGLLDADDIRPHRRHGREGAIRSFLVTTGRGMFAVHMALFARTAWPPRRWLLRLQGALAAVHAVGLMRLATLFRDEGRLHPPFPRFGWVHGGAGYLSLFVLLVSERRRRGRLTTLAEWYPYLGAGVLDVLDGALRRQRRPLHPYGVMAAVTAAAGYRRWRSRLRGQ